jgi:hypothetical protein
MSKRKTGKKPNLSAEVLARARREIYGDGNAAEAEIKADDTVNKVAGPEKVKHDKPKVTATSSNYQKRMLTSTELAQEYHYVIADLRSMAILAGILFVAMVVVSLLVI